jgi:hypothetical protein
LNVERGAALVHLPEALRRFERMNDREERVFALGGELVQVRRDGTVQPVTLIEMQALLARATRWASAASGREIDPPTSLVKAIFQSPSSLDHVPPLAGVVTTPVVIRDGSVLSTPGYDKSSGLFHVPIPWPDDDPQESAQPLTLDRARHLLEVELLGDFPFVSDADRANALAMLLQPFVREVIDGPTPLFWIDAPAAGHGKGKLADCLLAPACGRDIGAAQFPASEGQRRLRITGALRAGAPAFKWDNVTGRVDSAAFASALTEDRWNTDKGENLPIRLTWVLTSNGARPSSDIARRAVMIRLDAGVEKPARRTGPTPDTPWRHTLPAWAWQQRPELVGAALTICRAWIAAGMPRGRGGSAMGSYEAWEGVMAGILETAGILGFLDNSDAADDADADLDDLGALLADWHACFGTSELTAREVIEDKRLAHHFGNRKPQGLGMMLAERRDRIARGLVLRRVKPRGESARWHVDVAGTN